jgi:cobalamin-dependent methionine synthase I
MGVMVPCNQFLKKARKKKQTSLVYRAIAPSLEEMTYVTEMQRDDYFRSSRFL